MCSNVFKLVQNLFKCVQIGSNLIKTCSNDFKCVQMGLKLVQMCQMCSSLSKTCSNVFKCVCSNLFKTCSNVFKWVQTCSKLAQMSSNVFKWVQNLFKCVKCVPACPKLVQMCSKLFKNYQPFQCKGSDMTSRAWSSFFTNVLLGSIFLHIKARKLWHKFCIYGDVFFITHMPYVDNFRFLHFCYVETSEISQYLEKFSIAPLLSIMESWNISSWQIFLHEYNPWYSWQIWALRGRS